MKILVITEGTILVHKSAAGLPRVEAIKQVKNKEPSVARYSEYVPIRNSVCKLRTWIKNGATICYLTSRTDPFEIDAIAAVLKKHGFPKGQLFHRINEHYGKTAERVDPDVIVEDDCESIGGYPERTYPKLGQKFKRHVRSVVVKEFGGVDHLPGNPQELGIGLSIHSKENLENAMAAAVREADAGGGAGHGGPFGAVVTLNGVIIAQAHNTVLQTGDPTAHAEINALRKASKLLGPDLTNCEIYITCEPCPMCLAAILWARIKTIYYGCTKEDAKKLGFDDELFYRAISKRKHPLIKMKQTYRKQCLATFAKWKNSRNYHLY